jgi:hypothetical protein
MTDKELLELSTPLIDESGEVRELTEDDFARMKPIAEVLPEIGKFSVMQDGLKVASGECPDRETAEREANHYAMMYGQDGPVKVKVWQVKVKG